MIAAKPTPLILICYKIGMSYYIQIERVPYEEPDHLELHWTISSGEISSKFEIYDNASVLSDFVNALNDFPKHSEDKFVYQIGGEEVESKWAYFFRLIFSTNPRGHDATIDVKFLNHQTSQDTRIVDFRLHTNSPNLRKLAKLFSKFSKLKSQILYWDNSDAFVGSIAEFRSLDWKSADA